MLRNTGNIIHSFCFLIFVIEKTILRHLQTKSSFLPITIYISDYVDCTTFNFSYVFWVNYFSSDEIVEIHQMIEDRLSNLVEKGLV